MARRVRRERGVDHLEKVAAHFGVAGRVADVGVGQGRDERREDGRGLLLPPRPGPRAEGRDRVGRERADDGERAQVAAERERGRPAARSAVVLEEHDRLAGHVAGEGAVGVGEERGRLAGLVGVAERVVEEARAALDAEHASDGLVDDRQRERAALDERGQGSGIDPVDHAHVDAGHEGAAAGLGAVGRDPVPHQLADGRVVGDDEPVEAPLVAEDVGKEPLAARRRDAADLVERRHQRLRAGGDGGLERREDGLAERPLGDLGRVVVAAALGEPVAREVLGRRHERRLGRERAERGPLEAADAGLGEAAPQKRVLARALDDPPPPPVAGDVDHRRERPVDPGRGRLAGGDPGGLFGRVEVPRRRLGERDREDGPEPVDHVVPDDQRDPEAALADGHLLRAARVGGPVDVEVRADAAGADVVLAALRHGRPGHGPLAGVLRELPELLLERHPRQEVLDEGGLGVEVVAGVERGPRLGAGGGRQQDEGEDGKTGQGVHRATTTGRVRTRPAASRRTT